MGGWGGYGGYYDPSLSLASFGYGALAANSGGHHGVAAFAPAFASSDPLCSLALALGDVKSELINVNHNQTVGVLQGQNDIRRDIAKSECDTRADIKDVRFDITSELNAHDRNISEKLCNFERRVDKDFCDQKALIIEKFNGLELREVNRELKATQLALSQCQQNEALRGIADQTAERVIRELRCLNLLCPLPIPPLPVSTAKH